jgi:hypothetical protein
MPKINLNFGQRNMILSYETGDEGFVELYERRETDKNNLSQVLHIRAEEDGHIWATFFPPNQEEPDWFFDWDEYEETLN